MGTKAGTKPRAAVYVRLSRDRVGETSTERQEKDCRALASAKGYRVVEVFSDLDLSAYKRNVVRPSYERLLDGAASGDFDAVIIWKVDRLARSLREFVRSTEILDEYDVALISVNESFDSSSPMGKAMMQIAGVFAELESGNISLRTKSAKAHGAAKGKPNGGGRRPYGFTSTSFQEQIPHEIAVLKECADRLRAGESVRSITKSLNARGVLSATGKPWSTSHLGRVLRSPHLAGIRVHRSRHGKNTVEMTRTTGDWPAIFTLEEHEQLVAMTGEYREPSVRRHLLTDLARCGLCNATMRGKKTTRYGFQYACGGCARLVVAGKVLEDLIAEAALQRLESPAYAAAANEVESSDRLTERARQLADDRAALEQLSRDHYVDRTISRDVFLAAASTLEDRIAAAEQALERHRPQRATASSPREAWGTDDDFDLDVRREILRRVVASVTINPTSVRGRSKFDEDRIDVTWLV